MVRSLSKKGSTPGQSAVRDIPVLDTHKSIPESQYRNRRQNDVLTYVTYDLLLITRTSVIKIQ